MTPDKINPDSYLAHWLDLRRRERAAWLSFLLFLPGAGGIGFGMDSLTGSDKSGMYIAFAWMTMTAVFGARFSTFRCPRCQKQFFNVKGHHYGSTQECLHCGLPKYALTKTGEPKLTDFEYEIEE